MKISIVITIFNCEKYLRECLDSIVNQTYDNLEIVLVNDGSSDSSGEICKSYVDIDKRIKYVEKTNSGVMDARVVGFKNCSGDYIYSVDSDDIVDLNCVQTIVDEISNTKADIVCFNGYQFVGEINNKSVINNGVLGVFENNQIKEEILKKCIGGIRNVNSINNCLWLKFIKKFLIDNCLQYCESGIAFGEDMLVSFACIAQANKVVFIDEKFYYYRQFPEQSTKKYKTNLIAVEEKLIKNLLQINFDFNLNCKNEILRHALETAKATIFNEVKFGKKYRDVKNKILQLYSANFYNEMIINLKVNAFTKQEKIIFYLLKHKCTKTLILLAKLVKIIQGV